MFTQPAKLNTSALACAALVTLAMLGFVDGIARHEAQNAVLAATQAAPVAAVAAAAQG
jgi:hypothetical protein